MRSTLRSTGAVLVALSLAVSSGCASEGGGDYVSRVTVTTPPAPTTLGDQPLVAVLAPDLTGSGPGSLVEAVELKNVDSSVSETGARGMRVTYRSTSGVTGQETVVSGAVFVPAGVPPVGGWPVIAYGHSDTGVRYECAPSLHDDLLSYGPPVAELLQSGYVVAMPDYEGLGSAGAFPMYEPKTLGANMIDAMRVAHRITPQVSRRWASYGGSIGGAAAWAANEMAPTYAPEYEMAGSAALVPTADMSGLVASAVNGTLTDNQRQQYVLELSALRQTTHPELVIEDYVRGDTLANLDKLSACFGPTAQEAVDLVKRLPSTDTVPVSPEAADRLTGWLRDAALPVNKLGAPMLVVYSTDDELVAESATAAAIARSCEMGSEIESVLRVGQTHASVDGSPAAPFLRGVLDGSRPTVDTCTS